MRALMVLLVWVAVVASPVTSGRTSRVADDVTLVSEHHKIASRSSLSHFRAANTGLGIPHTSGLFKATNTGLGIPYTSGGFKAANTGLGIPHTSGGFRSVNTGLGISHTSGGFRSVNTGLGISHTSGGFNAANTGLGIPHTSGGFNAASTGLGIPHTSGSFKAANTGLGIPHTSGGFNAASTGLGISHTSGGFNAANTGLGIPHTSGGFNAASTGLGIPHTSGSFKAANTGLGIPHTPGDSSYGYQALSLAALGPRSATNRLKQPIKPIYHATPLQPFGALLEPSRSNAFSKKSYVKPIVETPQEEPYYKYTAGNGVGQLTEAILHKPASIKHVPVVYKSQPSSHSLEYGTSHQNKEYYAAKYQFGYQVRDPKGGNFFGHSEARDGDNTKGQYHVFLPDGRLQHVQYWADPSGYHAEISYNRPALRQR